MKTKKWFKYSVKSGKYVSEFIKKTLKKEFVSNIFNTIADMIVVGR